MCFQRQEYVVDADPLRDEYPLFDALPVPQDGRIAITDCPGIGITPDEALMRRLATE